MKQKRTTQIILSTIIILVSAIFLIPFLCVVSASFTSEMALKMNGYTILPSEFSLSAYEFIFENNLDELLSSYVVTIFVSVVGTVLGLIFMCGIAYPISRSDFKYKNIISFFIYFTMLFNGGTVAKYILISNYLHMTDTIWVLIIPLMLSAWNIFLLRTYFSAVPKEIVESARIDGLKEIGIFIKMIFPLSLHGIATVGLFTLLMYWNEWYSSMLYMNSDEIISLQYMLVKLLNNVKFLTQNASGIVTNEILPEDNIRMATCVLAAGPMVIVFPFFQKYFVKGITVGSVKG